MVCVDEDTVHPALDIALWDLQWMSVLFLDLIILKESCLSDSVSRLNKDSVCDLCIFNGNISLGFSITVKVNPGSSLSYLGDGFLNWPFCLSLSTACTLLRSFRLAQRKISCSCSHHLLDFDFGSMTPVVT